MSNLDLWNRVSITDPKFTKEVTISNRRFTSVDPTYLIQKATEEFGKYGETWGLRDLQWEVLEVGTTKILQLTGKFFTPGGEVATANAEKLSYISSKGKEIIDTDAYKKVMTNTISKELSRLGFAADVFMGKFDDERYVNMLEEEFTTANADDFLKTFNLDEKLKAVKTEMERVKLWGQLPLEVQGKEEVQQKFADKAQELLQNQSGANSQA